MKWTLFIGMGDSYPKGGRQGIADKIGMKYNTLSQQFGKRKNLHVETFEEICRILNISCEHFLNARPKK